MPDTLNKQTLINLLIDSPLREPIKINLIDIVNNTNEPDLPKVYSTITKELEIFQKATERRMKLADETIAKLGGAAPAVAPTQHIESPEATREMTPGAQQPGSPSLPPLDLRPLPPAPSPVTPPPTPVASTTPASSTPPLSVPPLDLPPLPTMPTPTGALDSGNTEAPAVAPLPTPQPLGASAMSSTSDEAALAEIQKELDSLKSSTAAEVTAAAAPAPVATPTVPQQ